MSQFSTPGKRTPLILWTQYPPYQAFSLFFFLLLPPPSGYTSNPDRPAGFPQYPHPSIYSFLFPVSQSVLLFFFPGFRHVRSVIPRHFSLPTQPPPPSPFFVLLRSHFTMFLPPLLRNFKPSFCALLPAVSPVFSFKFSPPPQVRYYCTPSPPRGLHAPSSLHPKKKASHVCFFFGS